MKKAPRRRLNGSRPAPAGWRQIERSPTSPHRARILRPANPKKPPTKDNPKMTARAARRISQPDSCRSARGRTGPALHYSFKSNVAQQCYRLRSSTRATTPRATLRQQVAARLNKKNRSPRDCHRLRSLTRVTNFNGSPAFAPSRLRQGRQPQRKTGSRRDHHRLRSSTRASSAARLHPRPESERPVGAQPHRLRGLTRAISSGRESRRRGAKLIHGSAIKSHGKAMPIQLLTHF